MIRNNKKLWELLLIAAVFLAFAAGNVFCAVLGDRITLALCGDGITFAGEEFAAAQKLGDDMCREIAGEGIVLLKNAQGALPLDGGVKKINVFGWSSTDAGFLLAGCGSGYGYGGGYVNIPADKKFSLLKALAADGFECNPALTAMYEEYKSTREVGYTLVEPGLSYYTADLMQNAREFSDTALVVISRFGGENIGEIPDYQPKYGQETDYGRTYLQTTAEEEDLLSLVSGNFAKVIVILNTCNNMHLNFLTGERVDAALYVGVTGQSGAGAIGGILKGEITPSGKRRIPTYTTMRPIPPGPTERRRAITSNMSRIFISAINGTRRRTQKTFSRISATNTARGTTGSCSFRSVTAYRIPISPGRSPACPCRAAGGCRPTAK